MKDCICEKIVNSGSSRELFCLSNQMMGTFGDIILPTNISHESLSSSVYSSANKIMQEINGI